MAWPCARSRPACCRPTGGPIRRRSPSRSGAAPCPIRSASPPASTRTPKCPTPCCGLGFGFVEIGSVTPRPQDGNPRPRLFRLTEDRGVINRMGFPRPGPRRRRARGWRRAPRRGFVGVNVGANKDSDRSRRRLRRRLRGAGALRRLPRRATSPRPTRRACATCRAAAAARRPAEARAGRASPAKPVPLLVKIAPDATDDDLDDIVAVCRELRMDGIIVGNTTLSRPPSLRSARRERDRRPFRARR